MLSGLYANDQSMTSVGNENLFYQSRPYQSDRLCNTNTYNECILTLRNARRKKAKLFFLEIA